MQSADNGRDAGRDREGCWNFTWALAHLKFKSTLWCIYSYENNKIPDENFKSLLLGRLCMVLERRGTQASASERGRRSSCIWLRSAIDLFASCISPPALGYQKHRTKQKLCCFHESLSSFSCAHKIAGGQVPLELTPYVISAWSVRATAGGGGDDSLLSAMTTLLRRRQRQHG
jgi:hypothetical protein